MCSVMPTSTRRQLLVAFNRCLKAGGDLLLNLPAYDWRVSRPTTGGFTTSGATRRPACAGSSNRAGLRIAGLGYWNSLLFPVMLVHRLVTRRPSESDVRGFPHWEGQVFLRDHSLRATAVQHQASSPVRRLGLAPGGEAVSAESTGFALSIVVPGLQRRRPASTTLVEELSQLG